MFITTSHGNNCYTGVGGSEGPRGNKEDQAPSPGSVPIISIVDTPNYSPDTPPDAGKQRGSRLFHAMDDFLPKTPDDETDSGGQVGIWHPGPVGALLLGRSDRSRGQGWRRSGPATRHPVGGTPGRESLRRFGPGGLGRDGGLPEVIRHGRPGERDPKPSRDEASHRLGDQAVHRAGHPVEEHPGI